MTKELKAAIRYLKQRGFDADRPSTEYAVLSGLNEKTIRRNKTYIPSYHSIAPLCEAQEALAMDKRLIEHLITCSHLKSFRDVLGALCGFLLIYRDKYLKEIKKSTHIVKIGTAYFDLVIRILSRKDQSLGVPVHSSNTALRYLKKAKKSENFFDHYFTVNHKYYAGSSSKRYKLTNKSEALIKKLGVLIRKNLSIYVQLLGKHMGSLDNIYRDYLLRMVPLTLSTKELPIEPPENTWSSYSPPYICLSGKRTLVRHKDCIFLDACEVASLSLPSLLQVMAIASLDPDKKKIIVPLKNLSSTKSQYGRNYNIFTRLRSTERKALGYINYDLSGGIQIISFGILFKYASHLYETPYDLISTYPMILKYGWDPEYKKELRKQLAKDLNKTIPEVKSLLTAYANGSKKSVCESRLLNQFREESDQLRKEVISVIKSCEPEIQRCAQFQSKHSFPDDLDWEEISEDETLAREKASVYFFIWTYFEKQIRDAMLTVVDDGIPVHDAIYSKENVAFDIFEKAIFDQTGFEVKIGH